MTKKAVGILSTFLHAEFDPVCRALMLKPVIKRSKIKGTGKVNRNQGFCPPEVKVTVDLGCVNL